MVPRKEYFRDEKTDKDNTFMYVPAKHDKRKAYIQQERCARSTAALCM